MNTICIHVFLVMYFSLIIKRNASLHFGSQISFKVQFLSQNFTGTIFENYLALSYSKWTSFWTET